jgi:spore coat polysaccharide biosynthesis protein SpsF
MTVATNIVHILQVRLSSARLPGKVLKDILGKPMLERQIERLRRAEALNQLVVATSDRGEDDAIELLCQKLGVDCFRGSLNDVLTRFYQCALKYSPKHVVRLTGDCPLADPAIIDEVVRLHLEGNYDYTSNTNPPTWPDGMDVEVMKYECLAEAYAEAELPSEREHVTLFIYRQPERYRLGSLTQEEDLSALRLTVDEPEDLELVTKIYERLYPQNHDFTLADILALLDKTPALKEVNQRFGRNEGSMASEENDRAYLAKE